MVQNNRIEIYIDGQEMEAHRFFQSEHVKISQELYAREAFIEKMLRRKNGKGMTERQLNAFQLAHRAEYTALGTLDRIMYALREKATR